MMKTSFTADKFGFYTVGDRTTYSKMEALEWASTTSLEAEWNFNHSAFSALDWKHEPETDLWTLYKMRAKQIRENYDYVVLWYSGGSDSHNLLLAWIDAGLKIDEIATTWNYEATSDAQNHYNAEITNVVFPDVQKLKDSGIEFKFRLVDISQYCIDLFETWHSDFEYNVNFHVSPNNPAKHLFRDKISDYKNMIEAGKKVCFVWGKEKPFMVYENGKHAFRFCDNIDNCVGPYVQKKYHQGWYDELFYWSPDFPLIPIKQAHVVKNFITHSTDAGAFADSVRGSYKSNGYSPLFDKFLKDEPVKTLLYPKWSNDIFCNGKAHSFVYSARDKWLLTSNVLAGLRYRSIVNSIYGRLDPLRREEDGFKKNMMPFYSPLYYLE